MSKLAQFCLGRIVTGRCSHLEKTIYTGADNPLGLLAARVASIDRQRLVWVDFKVLGAFDDALHG